MRDFTTVCDPVTVTDRKAVNSLISDYRWPLDLDVQLGWESNVFKMTGRNFLECYRFGGDQPDGALVAQEPALDEFFDRLQHYLPDDERFVVQSIGAEFTGNDEFPLYAEQWVVTADTIDHTRFKTE